MTDKDGNRFCKLCHSPESEHEVKVWGCPVAVKADGSTLYGPSRFFPADFEADLRTAAVGLVRSQHAEADAQQALQPIRDYIAKIPAGLDAVDLYDELTVVYRMAGGYCDE